MSAFAADAGGWRKVAPLGPPCRYANDWIMFLPALNEHDPIVCIIGLKGPKSPPTFSAGPSRPKHRWAPDRSGREALIARSTRDARIECHEAGESRVGLTREERACELDRVEASQPVVSDDLRRAFEDRGSHLNAHQMASRARRGVPIGEELLLEHLPGARVADFPSDTTKRGDDFDPGDRAHNDRSPD